MGCSAHAIFGDADWDDKENTRSFPDDESHSGWWVEDRPSRNYLPPESTWLGALPIGPTPVAKSQAVSLSLVGKNVEPPSALESAIAEARRLFSLGIGDGEDDVDTEVVAETLDRAVNFLHRTAQLLFERDGIAIEIPDILPGPSGSVDLLWRNHQYELLVNIPPGHNTVADFYGDTPDGLNIKGAFKPEIHHRGILAWFSDHR